ncbi:MAG: Dipeptidyl aminopeptidase/acylaminoacyl-peptidase-like protein [Microgenomates group bacterium GW2011_GWC1_46_16]|uniref:Serine aminopeptidase S33 domain-containing protein n=2 Tax=Candidatus Collieribacteriota TaxID=1752725 RepID=A0A1F5FZ38_9BACT|nr:MAG: Dipeptidyl aminopeptidase/acylaminoacyl-peptidase-like protein [Microgenomates group bacterium GW2011_GWF1_46_12]KKU26185.1 MAG: Dipeptidyl aminopeptidase/acylaminoacyl-peptidase-like protein [Microgenomates group bacterium GW2011_GWC1_46_16]KKU28165.1 MAG: Dipeptidyl aminopeptidase/acylaminoacyl-peptidase-like protein [Microgenomates group bacterium GW2011_GWF2_46_18]KKU43750.1 MAG: Dipeptidyl aminopeptidase/acylaminoacyl-peptidase-like protein [Microgenomates group bacterium GW2011_GWA
MQTTNVNIPLSNGSTLKGLVLQNPTFSGKRPVILVIHGWTSAMARYPVRIEPVVEAGHIAVLYDMRGHGETGGDLSLFSRQDHLDDCLAAYDFMVNLPNADTSDISVFGSSYGGYMGTLVAQARKVDKILLKAPALYPDEGWNEPKLSQEQSEVTSYRLSHHTKENNKALKAISEFQGKILFMACELDQEVPKQVMDDYREAISIKYDYELLKGADHACKLPGTEKLMIDTIDNWYKTNLK